MYKALSKSFFLVVLYCFSASAQETAIFKRGELDFKKLAVDQLYFPQNFLFGFAIAEYQNSGADNLPDCNWTRWEHTRFPNGHPHIKGAQHSGISCDHWHLYETDIDLMKKDFNANAFRFSVDWSKIEPQEGQFSESALQHYSDEVDALLKAGITPMITLHHFTHPNWFEEKGGFERRENIQHFVTFSTKVFERLSDRVHLWCTINEPTIYMFQGYLPFNCVFPPGKGSWTSSWPLAVKVLRNLLEAHTEVYHTLKKMTHGDTAQIGLVHQYLKFEAYSFFNFIELFPGMMLNTLMVDSVIAFLKTGTFSYGWPLYFHEEYTAPMGKVSDFVGLNYYSRAMIEFQYTRLKAVGSCKPWETMTDMPYAIYPQGLYNALVHVAQIGLPIYITENGIADRNDVNDENRKQWIKEYLKAVSLALEDGIDIRGYFWWTLTDNFEWDEGRYMKFGLYSVDPETRARKLKEGSKTFADIIKNVRNGKLSTRTDDWPWLLDTRVDHRITIHMQA